MHHSRLFVVLLLLDVIAGYILRSLVCQQQDSVQQKDSVLCVPPRWGVSFRDAKIGLSNMKSDGLVYRSKEEEIGLKFLHIKQILASEQLSRKEKSGFLLNNATDYL